jgi:hypothetical protein
MIASKLMFNLSLADGAPVTTATARLSVSAIGPDSTLADPLDISSGAAADNGSVFRFTGNHYQFNLGTLGWHPGRYRVTIALDDGRSYWMEIVLR